jgi:hypothetical protein
VQTCVKAFHEKAGPRQVDFDLPFPGISLSFLYRAARSGQGRVLCGVQRTLEGEDRSSAIRYEGKVGRIRRRSGPARRLRATTVATLPSAGERFLRSVSRPIFASDKTEVVDAENRYLSNLGDNKIQSALAIWDLFSGKCSTSTVDNPCHQNSFAIMTTKRIFMMVIPGNIIA